MAFASGEIDSRGTGADCFYAIGWPGHLAQVLCRHRSDLPIRVIAALKATACAGSPGRNCGEMENIRAGRTKYCRSLLNTDGPRDSPCPIPRGDQLFGLSAMLCDRGTFDAESVIAGDALRTAFTSGTCATWFRSMDWPFQVG